MIYSITGRLVKTLQSENNLSGTELNISDLTQGVYFIILTDDKSNQITKKLIKE
jgi:hypothetical protein